MRSKYSVKLKTIAEEMKLTPLHTSADYEQALIITADVNRPAMQLTGFYNYFDPHRLQIMGRVESTYLDTLSHEERLAAFKRFMQYDISCLVICHGMQPFPECLEMAEKFDRNVFMTSEATSEFQADVISTLHNYLAPRITTHGVLVEVYGEGVLLTGDSGVGKSETALELLKRGHRLIADDAVEVRRVSNTTLVGSAPDNIRHYMELRGVGIINVSRLFGVGSVKNTANINFVIQLETYDPEKVYDRIGLEEETTNILGMKVPAATIPVQTGRNLAVIIEVATMNYRQRAMGNNSAKELMEQLGLTDDVQP